MYTASEVATHSTPSDCWVSLLGRVLDLTSLLADNPGPLAQPIIRAAGTDISHWFDPDTCDVKTYVKPETNVRSPYLPMGRFLHIPPDEPVSNYSMSLQTPWWKDRRYQVGLLTSRTRLIRIRNVLTEQEDQLEVPVECTVGEIRELYLECNWHAKSYHWRAQVRVGGNLEFVPIDMSKTLEQNGIADESIEFEELGLPVDMHVPVVFLYYMDDLTVA